MTDAVTAVRLILAIEMHYELVTTSLSAVIRRNDGANSLQIDNKLIYIYIYSANMCFIKFIIDYYLFLSNYNKTLV